MATSGSDIDGDVLVYSLVDARSGPTSPLPYQTGLSGTNPFTNTGGITIDANTGLLTFNANAQQVAVIGVRIQEYRSGVLIGEVYRDFIIKTAACATNAVPVINAQSDVTLGVGQAFTRSVSATDANTSQLIALDLSSGVLPPATFNITSSGGGFSNGTFSYTPGPSDAGKVFTVAITATDDNCPIPGLALRTFNITVTNSLSTNSFASPVCAGTTSTVDYTSSNVTYLAGNVFTAQLSNASGAFLSPVTLGTLASTSSTGSIPITIPANTLQGTGYRIRVVSSNPSVTGLDNGANITIYASNPGTYTAQCNNGSFTMSANNPSPATGLWTLVSGTASITTSSSPTTTITGVPAGTSAVVNWAVTNGVCTSNNTTTLTNNGGAITWYRDADADGYYGSTTTACVSPGAGWYNYAIGGILDCNDNNAGINPGSTEICGNGIDEDCSGADLLCPGISTGTVLGPFCLSGNINVPFTVVGNFTAGNIFTAQLSNAAGSFASPTNIGSLAATTSGTIVATIPGGTPSGTGYRIRVVGSNPSIIGSDNGVNITINPAPTATRVSTGGNSVCAGQTVLYGVTSTNTTTYAWSLTPPAAGTLTPNGVSALVDWSAAYSGTATLSCTPSNTCATGTAATFAITVNSTHGVTIANYPYQGTFGGKHYYLSNATAVWAAAKLAAEGECANLVAVSSAAEQTYVSSILNTASRWLGGTDEITEGSFMWVNGENAANFNAYTNWYAGEPNNGGGNENCMEMRTNATYSNQWNDAVRTAVQRFIMERTDNENLLYLTLSDSVLCANSTFTASFSNTGVYDIGNVFKVELSDNSSSFATATVIGSQTASSVGAISCTIPNGTANGSSYKIRLISTSPVDTLDAYTLIRVGPLPASSTLSGDPVIRCNGAGTSVYSASAVTSAVSYTWSIAPVAAGTLATSANNVTVTWDPTFSGMATLTMTANSGCVAGTPANFNIGVLPWQPSVVFTETMGSVAASTTVAAHETANGFDNDAYTMSASISTVVVNNTTLSSGYTGASGGANVQIPSGAFLGPSRTFTIDGINTVGKNNLVLRFGVRYTGTFSSFSVAASTDGTTYTTLTRSNTEPSTNWQEVVVLSGIPQAANLRIRITGSSVLGSTVYVDDIRLTYNNSATPTISAAGPTTFCTGGSVMLRTGITYTGYLWNNAATTQAITVSTSGTFNMQAIDNYGCPSASSNSITVTATPIPTWYLDADNDNYYTGSPVTQCTSPGAGYKSTGLIAGGDCNDANAAINPGATEITCNGIDENCNGMADDDAVAPVITVPSNIVTTAASGSCTKVVNYTAPTATDNCGVSSNLVINGNFETGDLSGWNTTNFGAVGTCGSTNQDWKVSNNGATGTGCSNPGDPVSGIYAAYNMFDANAPLTYRMYQTITLPNAISAASMQYLYAFTGSFSGSPRVFAIKIYNASNTTVLASLDNITVPSGAPTVPWTSRNLFLTSALTPFAGQTVILDFSVAIPQVWTGPAGFGIDSIVLNVTNSSTSITQTAGLPSGSAFPVGNTVNTFQSTDANGNVSTNSFTVTVNTTDIWYLDADNDGYYVSSTTACSSPGAGYNQTATILGDCDDNNSSYNIICPGTYIWTGATSTAWAVATNWSPNTPGAGPNACTDAVIIPSAPVGGFPQLNQPKTVGNITMQDGATLGIGGFGSLSICGDFVGASATASAVTGAGSVILNGTTAQSISGAVNFETLVINKASGLTTNTGNIGVGKALVMQDGDFTNNGTVTLKSNASTTAYLDNFTSGTAGTYNGNLTVERHVSNTADGYRDISSPVATTVAGLADDISIFGQNGVNCWYSYNPYPNVQVYDEAANNALSTPAGNYYTGWISYTGTGNPLTAMKGVAVRTYNGAPYTIDLTGAPYNGPQSIGISHTTTATPSADGWNLTGNPYPSPIDWNDVLAANTGIGASYYAFNTTGEYAGNYSSWNGSTGTNGGTRNIAIGQGFFVYKTNPGSQSLSMTNAVREADASTVFHKSNPVMPNEVRLQLTGNGNSDEIVAYTDGNATWNYDMNYDAKKIAAGSTVYMSYKHLNTEYAIDVIDEVTVNTELPLILWAQDTGSYTFEATALNTTGLIAQLKDSEANTLVDLTTTIPNLQLNGGQTYTNYSIVFKEEEQQPSAIAEPKNTISIYASGNQIYVNRSTTNAANITVTNLLGQTIIETPATGKNTVIRTTDGTEAQYLIVKVTEGNQVSVKKVFISNR